MATGGAGTATSPQPIVQALHGGAPPAPSPLAPVSPPSKRELASWWKKFRKTTEKTDEKGEPTPVSFHTPLENRVIDSSDEEMGLVFVSSALCH